MMRIYAVQIFNMNVRLDRLSKSKEKFPQRFGIQFTDFLYGKRNGVYRISASRKIDDGAA